MNTQMIKVQQKRISRVTFLSWVKAQKLKETGVQVQRFLCVSLLSTCELHEHLVDLCWKPSRGMRRLSLHPCVSQHAPRCNLIGWAPTHAWSRSAVQWWRKAARPSSGVLPPNAALHLTCRAVKPKITGGVTGRSPSDGAAVHRSVFLTWLRFGQNSFLNLLLKTCYFPLMEKTVSRVCSAPAVVVFVVDFPEAQRDEEALKWNQTRMAWWTAHGGDVGALARANGPAGSGEPVCPLCAATAAGVKGFGPTQPPS